MQTALTKPAPTDYSLPRFALIGGGALVVMSLALALTGRLADIGTVRIPPAPAVAETSLRFVNGADGSVTITDGRDRHLVRHVAPGTDGFIWGAINGLSRGRKLGGVALDAPYDLSRREDGRMILADPATGQSIVLAGFGHGNAAVFAKLLDAREQAR